MSYVSDIITNEELDTWKPKDTILLTAGTGTGKSRFVLNSLNQYAKERGRKVLLLVPRSSIEKQFQMQLSIDDTHFDIRTYQWIESRILREKNSFPEYDYIVADEAHYFLDDSSFNHTTELSFQWIMKHSATKIMMSATSKILFGLINMYIEEEKIKQYQLPQNFENIEHVFVYPFSSQDPYQYVLETMQELKSKGEKALIFINNKSEASKLHKFFPKDSYFFHGGKLSKKRELELQKILRDEKFDKTFLITTSILDTGVTLIDKDLKHIFLDSNSMNTLLQMYGRKRFIDKNDKVTLHIRNFNNLSLGGAVSRSKRTLKPLDCFIEHGEKEFLVNYPLLTDNIGKTLKGIYLRTSDNDSGIVQVSKLFYFHTRMQLEWYEYLLKNNITFGEEVVKMFNSEDKSTFVDTAKKVEKIYSYLEEIAGEKIYAEEREELIDMISVNYDGKQLRGRASINGFLEEYELPFEISHGKDNKRNITDENGKSMKNPYYKRAYWMVNMIE